MAQWPPKLLAQWRANYPQDQETGFTGCLRITYADGFGRPVQKILQQGSPLSKDVVQYMAYDNMGRQSKSYLPYVSGTATDGLYKTGDQQTAVLDFYYTNPPAGIAADNKPWGEVDYEESPLARVLEHGSVGTDWQLGSKTQKFDYGYNTASDNIYKWQVSDKGGLLLSPDNYYAANRLAIKIIKDEHWISADNDKGTVHVFTDKYGRKILERVYDDTETAYDTYYVYDDFGNLCYIIPPMAVDKVDNDLESELTSLDEDNVFTEDYTFTGTDANDETYYYLPGVCVTLPQTITFVAGFELKQYPIDASFISEWVYMNKYDAYNRPIVQKSPGSDSVCTVYDARHRPVLTQDGNQRENGEWSFVKYDVNDRPVLTGFISDSRDRVTLEQDLEDSIGIYYSWHEDKGTTVHGYTNTAYPGVSSEADYLTVVYHDDYDFVSSWGTAYEFDDTNDVNTGPEMTWPKGQVTGGKVKILGKNTWLKSVVYYDYEYRAIQSINEHHRDYGGYTDKSYTLFDFTGNVTKSKLIHQTDVDKYVTIRTRSEYDHAGRIEKTYYQLDETPEIILAAFSYNELGELIDKKLHSSDDGSSYIQSIDYRYNIRGWLSSINNAQRSDDSGTTNDDTNDLFGMEVYYNSEPSGLSLTEQYNGNIAGITWSNSKMTNRQRSYGYTYDKMGRLDLASYKENAGTGWTSNSGHFDEEIEEYDKNGNIIKLNRKAAGTQVDQLEYDYTDNGNRITAVNDVLTNTAGFNDGAEETVEYGYDRNGNLVYDKNKSIEDITYNRLDLPEVIAFENGNEIKFMYDATGAKLTQKLYVGGTEEKHTDYVGGFVYEGNIEDDSLRFISTAEGRIVVQQVANDFDYDYQYYLTDHLGNTRVVFGSKTRIYTATMESELSDTEEAEFKNIEHLRSTNYNNTSSSPEIGNPNESAMLNAALQYPGGERKVVGPAKGIKVYPGDTVEMEVYARYDNPCTGNQVTRDVFLFSALTAAFGIAETGETAQIYDAFDDAFGQTLLFDQNTCDVPTAFLNYILFDKDYNSYATGHAQVTSSAASGFEKLTITQPNITAEGYMYIYVSNESDLDVNVYFDDLKITHTSATSVIQTDDYYPFGLPIAENRYQNTDEVPNRFLYQGKEWIADESLAWYDFHARMYDPVLGRFMSTDPQGQFASPYAGMGNNPIIGVDPDGELAWFIPIIAGAVINTALNAKKIDNVWDALGYAAVGAASAALGAGLASGVSLGLSTAGLGGSLGSGFATGFGAAFQGGVGLAGSGLTGASGVLAGALTGAISGYGAGFIAGSGNALVSGENISTAINQGNELGSSGALFGAVAGAFSGALDAISSNKSIITGQSKSMNQPPELDVDFSALHGGSKLPKGSVKVHRLVMMPRKYNGKFWTFDEWYNFDPLDPSTIPDGLFPPLASGAINPDYTLESLYMGGKTIKAGLNGLSNLSKTRWFRKYVFNSFPSEKGKGIQLLNVFRYHNHHVKYHGPHRQIDINWFGKWISRRFKR